MKLEAIYSAETSCDFRRTTRHYIPEDNALILQMFNYGDLRRHVDVIVLIGSSHNNEMQYL
jgi:hypothetical protein